MDDRGNEIKRVDRWTVFVVLAHRGDFRRTIYIVCSVGGKLIASEMPIAEGEDAVVGPWRRQGNHLIGANYEVTGNSAQPVAWVLLRTGDNWIPFSHHSVDGEASDVRFISRKNNDLMVSVRAELGPQAHVSPHAIWDAVWKYRNEAFWPKPAHLRDTAFATFLDFYYAVLAGDQKTMSSICPSSHMRRAALKDFGGGGRSGTISSPGSMQDDFGTVFGFVETEQPGRVFFRLRRVRSVWKIVGMGSEKHYSVRPRCSRAH